MTRPSERMRELAHQRCIRRGVDDARQPVHGGVPMCTAITCDDIVAYLDERAEEERKRKRMEEIGLDRGIRR